jgi:hypothetical protein
MKRTIDHPNTQILCTAAYFVGKQPAENIAPWFHRDAAARRDTLTARQCGRNAPCI